MTGLSLARRTSLFLLAALGANSAVVANVAAGEAWLKVELRPEVQVSQATVRLADVALLSSPDLDLLRRALNVSLGMAPRLGDEAVLQSDRLGYWIRSRTGLRDDQIEWIGSRQTLVKTAVKELPGEQVVERAQSALRAHIQSLAQQRGIELSELTLHPITVPASVLFPMSARKLEVRPLNQTGLSARMLVWVDVFSDEGQVRAVPVRFDVAASARLPVAVRGMATGASLDADSIASQEVDLTKLAEFPRNARGAHDRGAHDGASLVMRKSVRAGEVVSSDKYRTRPAVAKGEWVSLVSQQGSLSLESRAEALQDGMSGQLIRVKPANATQALTARVVGQGQLELQP